MAFRSRLLATLRAIRPVLEVEGVMVVGSELPNLLEPGAASTLVVSQDVDVAVPLAAHEATKVALRSVTVLRPSAEEPSVWVPASDELLEVNFVGLDPGLTDPTEVHVQDDDELPLMVFGALSLLRPGTPLDVEGLRIPRPRLAGLALEKLLTDRTGAKGDRDLLVVAGLLALADDASVDELVEVARTLPAALRHAVVSNLSILSLLPPHEGMPDPRPVRALAASVLRRFDGGEETP
jgi:hypothetical protein